MKVLHFFLLLGNQEKGTSPCVFLFFQTHFKQTTQLFLIFRLVFAVGNIVFFVCLFACWKVLSI